MSGVLAEWVIFYSNGRAIDTYSSIDGPVIDAPGFDVQVISMVTPGIGWHTQSLSDYYVWDYRGIKYRWWGVDLMGLGDYLNKRGQWQKILKGTTIHSALFAEILDMARHDKRLPQKTSYTRIERQQLANIAKDGVPL